jgi:UDP:flavonoid glycosyltransferase YjiC (YdhE family)
MIRMILKIIGWLIRHSLLIVLRSIPWVVKALIYILMLAVISVGSLRVGVSNTVKIMADEWLTRALKAGFPPQWGKYLHYVDTGLAILTIFAGWMLLVFTAVFIVRSMF